MSKPLIEQRPEGDYFTGDLTAAKRILRNEYGDYLSTVTNANGTVTVTEHRGGTPDNPNQWGTGCTEDEAWRYLAGQDFGPTDDEYDEGALRRALDAASETTED